MSDNDEDDFDTDELKGMDDTELKDMISRNVAQTNNLKLDKKEYAAGINSTIKLLDKKNAVALRIMEERTHE